MQSQIGNSKFEIRNEGHDDALFSFEFWSFEFDSSFEFRISNFFTFHS